MAEKTNQEKKKFSIKGLFNKPSQPYANAYLGGVLLGLVLFFSYFITGNGLGASGGLSRYAAFIEDLIAPGHIDQVPYLINMAGGQLNPLDSWIVVVTTGVLIGGFVSGVIHGRTKFETNKGPNIPIKPVGYLPSWVGYFSPMEQDWPGDALPDRHYQGEQPYLLEVGW